MIYSALSTACRGGAVEFYQSDAYRHVVDPNRAAGADTHMRQQMRTFMTRYPTARILEIHSFPAETLEGDWRGLPLDTMAVVLTSSSTPDKSSFEYELLANMQREGGVRVQTLAGDPIVNDIMREAREKGWTHALIELRYDTSDEQLGVIIRAIKSTVM